MAQHYDILIVLVGSLLAMWALYGGLRARARQRLIGNLPTSRVHGVFIGFVELEGTAEAEEPLTSHLAEVRCVYYSWSVQEHWSRMVPETYTDSKGNTKTRMRHESGWSMVADGGDSTPFYLQDDTGVIRVLPDGATIEGTSVLDETCGQADPLYYDKGPAEAVASSDHRRRFSESAIPLHNRLYVLGQARERDDLVAPEIADHDEAPTFLITCRSEARVARGLGWRFWGFALLALVLAVGAVLVADLVGDRSPIDNAPTYITAGILFLGAWSLGWIWMAFNSLVDLRQRVDRAWSLIDVQLKRRADLIPGLTEIVGGLRDHENTLHSELTELRTQAGATGPGMAGPDPHACRPIARITLEHYPELKTNEAFLDLHDQLTDTEERIALARSYFNDIATHLNARLELIPDRWIAPIAGLRRRELMAAAGFERAPVRVTLAE